MTTATHEVLLTLTPLQYAALTSALDVLRAAGAESNTDAVLVATIQAATAASEQRG